MEEDILPNRLNYDAEVFRGCDMKEMVVISTISLTTSCLLCGFITLLLFGHFGYGFAMGIMASMGFVYIFTAILQRLKQGKPKGFLTQVMQKILTQKGLLKSPVNRRSGRWSVGRPL